MQAQEVPAQVRVGISYEKQTQEILVSLKDGMPQLQLHVYLITGVFPTRQKMIVQGKTLFPDTDLTKFGLRDRDKVMLMQLPPGQELEPVHHLSSHPVDRIRSKVIAIGETAGMLESAVGACRDLTLMPKLNKLAMITEDSGMKLMLKVDELTGDENVRAARKQLVLQLNQELDRLEKCKNASKARE